MIDNKTKRERLQKWIDALRSGEYQQAHGQFHAGDGHCCLGVAELCAKMRRRKGDIADDYNRLALFYDLGIDTECSKLWHMNDVHHASFSEIADYIEQNLMPVGD